MKHSEQWRRWQTAVTWLGLIALPLIYFFPAVLGQVALVPGDGLTQNLGVRVLIGQMLASGQWPLWNPYIFAGTPLLASIYPGALYPPNWVFALLPPQAAINLVVITTYHLTLIGTYLYARRIGCRRVGALLAGTAFTFGAYMVAHLGHTSRIAAAAWLPWILLALEALYQQVRWRWVTLGAGFIALQLFAGEPQMNLYTVLVAGSYGLFCLLVREERERRLRVAGAFGMMALCGLLLSLVALLPQREFLAFGERAAIDYDYFSQFSFPPRELFVLFFPYFFGGASMSPYQVRYWGAFGGTEWMGYAGMLTWLLALCGVLRWRRWGGLSWFWAGWAVLALVLAFGGYLPFELNRLLFQIPVYKLFRASGRHMFEFTFALSVLAGLGYTALAEAETARARRLAALSSALLLGVIALGGVVYRYLPEKLVTNTPLPANAKALTNLEFAWPAAFCILSVLLLWLFVAWRGRSLVLRAASGVLLVAVLLADGLSWGYFYEWRLHYYNIADKLADPPAVKFIKEREPDLNSFRIASLSPRPYADNYELLNFPNVSIARGLQSVNGYDALRLTRVGDVAGGLSIDGYIGEPEALTLAHHGFDLLNVKYLLRERPEAMASHHLIERGGVQFINEPLNVFFSNGKQAQLAARAPATELVLVTALGNAVHLSDGQPVLKLRLHTSDGRVLEQEVQAGRDTSEWAWERPDVRARIKHQRAEVCESWPVENWEGHKYLARMRLDPTEITGIEIAHVPGSADLTIYHASLFDAATKTSTPLSQFPLPPAHWRKLETFGPIEVYENLRPLPRTWFVRRAEVLPGQAVLQTIKSGQLPGGGAFNPAETVLFEKEDFGARPPTPPPIGDTTGAEVKVTRYEPQRIELQTRNPQQGFLVLSEIYYRGWDAWIDGQRVPVERVNYVLRGLSVPPGEHRIEFKFRAPSFKNGARYTALGLLLLLAGALAARSGINGKLGGRFLGLRKWAKRQPLAFWLALVLLTGYFVVLARGGARAVGGSDSSGYANIARALQQGPLKLPVREVIQFGINPSYGMVFCPLGYLFLPPNGALASQATFYPIGFPVHMLIGARLLGWQTGPYLVNPLLATLSLLLLFLIGKQLGLGTWWAAASVVLLAVNPTFVFHTLIPMSDVAALFWGLFAVWTALRTRQTPYWAFATGAAFGIAVLVRPTNILLFVPLLFCLPLRAPVWFWLGLGGLPCAALFCAYNLTSYGHPLQTGYGAIGLAQAIMFAKFGTRLWTYLGHLTLTLGPLLCLGWLGVAAVRQTAWRTRALLLAWFGAFLIFYSCYDIYETWGETRFLLPGYPGLFLGACLTAQALWHGSGRKLLVLRRAAVAALLLATLAASLRFEKRFQPFAYAAGQSVHEESSRWADAHLPQQTLLVSMEMSGALRFYTQRSIFRWDLIPPGAWPQLHRQIQRHGYQLYALLLGYEVEQAQTQVLGRWHERGYFGPVSLWQIEPADNPPPQVKYLSGFYEQERAGENTFRWMGAEGIVQLQNLGQPMRLGIAGGIPANVFSRPSTLKLSLNGQPLAQTTLNSPAHQLEVVISPAQQGNAAWSELRLTLDQSFSPKQVNPANPDQRILGFSLTDLRWEPLK